MMWMMPGDAVVVTVEGEQGDEKERLQTTVLGVSMLQVDGEDVAGRKRRLTLPEAYYAASDGALPVDGSLQDLWQQFSTFSTRFPKQYAVFHHFRRLGWILKSGLNYGAHFVLYRGSAVEFHSEYIVYVHDEEVLSWNTVQSLTRIAADVKKTVLVCTVEVSPLATASNSKAYHTEDAKPDLIFGEYSFHNAKFTVEAVAVRFWDVSTNDKQSYNFQQQPVLAKKVKKKNKAKRPKQQIKQ